MRSMVTTEELMLNSRPQTVSTNTTSSAPQVLIAKTNSARGQDSRALRDTRINTRSFKPQVCRNFTRGFCRWGNTCKFIHDSNRATPTVSSNSSRSATNGQFNYRRVNTTTDTGIGQYNLGLVLSECTTTIFIGLMAQFTWVGLPSIPQQTPTLSQQQQQALLAQSLYGSTSTQQPSLHALETLFP
ncbi:hybrid signal transduction histidine kinase M [Tanacetum coccineum]